MEQIKIEGWKGKDEISISKVGSDFQIIEHRKDKDGNIKELTRIIPLSNVISIAKLIDNNPKDKIEYRELVSSIIEENKLDVDLDSFNGGKNRAKYYFPLYYYPIKVLEAKKKIKYTGRGTVLK